MSAWHSKTAAQVLAELDTSRDRGLTGAEAEERLGRYGPNVLEEGKRPGLALRFLAQLKDPMILVLLGAAGLSLWAGGGEDWVDAVIILVIVLVNACISIAQENSAEKALEALRNMSAPMARVVRDGERRRTEAAKLVPGDIILLEAGDMVSACRRLMVCACEDVGLAYPTAATVVKSCVDIALAVGLPEAYLPLAEAVILLATSPKSNSAMCAYQAALEDVRAGRGAEMPSYLRDAHFAAGAVRGKAYRYPHEYPNGYVRQQYLPDELKDRVYYRFGRNRTEQAAREYRERLLREADGKVEP